MSPVYYNITLIDGAQEQCISQCEVGSKIPVHTV